MMMDYWRVEEGMRVSLIGTEFTGTIRRKYTLGVIIAMDNGDIVEVLKEELADEWCIDSKPRKNLFIGGSLSEFKKLYNELGDVTLVYAISYLAPAV